MKVMQVAVAMTVMLIAAGGATSIRNPLPTFEEAYKTADISVVGRMVSSHRVYCDFHETGKCKDEPFNKFSVSQRYKRKIHVLRKLKGTKNDYIYILSESEMPIEGEFLLFIYKTTSRYYEASGSSVGFHNGDPRHPQALKFIKKITGEEYVPSAQ